jgi:photosystem II stability/assembly factor-like uncharacterized protein
MLLVFLLCFAVQLPALDLNQADRLALPARHFGHLDQTAFLSVSNTGKRLIAVGERGVIGFSDDQGKRWQQAKVPVSTLVTAITTIDSQHMWAVGHSGSILFSMDAGESWQLQFDGRQANSLLIGHAEVELKALEAAFEQADDVTRDDLQFAIDDAQFALSNARFDAELGPANPFLDVLFLDRKLGYAVGAYGLFVKTQDGGKSWQTVAHHLENFDRYHLNAIARLQGGTLLIAGEAGTLFASYDGGETWETLYGPYQGSYFGIQMTKLEDEAFLYGLKGRIFTTSDGGQSWQDLPSGVETSLTGSAISEQGKLVLVGLSGVVLLRNAPGESFIRIKTQGYEGFNDVVFIDETQLLLTSDEGLQVLNVEN